MARGGRSTVTPGGEHPPAAVATSAPAPAGVEASGRPGLAFHEIDGKDARDRADKPSRSRSEDYLNDAVGSLWYIGDADSSRVPGDEMKWVPWLMPRAGGAGLRFTCTRYYWHKRVAVDFPRDAQEAKLCEAKRTVLRGLGIAYVCIGYGESLTPDQVAEKIAAEWVAIEGMKSVPALPAPDAAVATAGAN